VLSYSGSRASVAYLGKISHIFWEYNPKIEFVKSRVADFSVSLAGVPTTPGERVRAMKVFEI
jgi:hypothetical protein